MSSGIVKWVLGYQRFVASKQIEKIMSKSVSEYALRDLPLVPNPRVGKILESSFINKYGGIHLLVAPSGSGKATYLRTYANRFISEGGRVQFFASELQSRKQFFSAFGDENRSMDLFEMLPKKSAIVFDQIGHQEKLNDDMKSLLKHLAFESRRVSGVSIIISTASIPLAKEILNLNGNDKIRLNGAVADWRWTPDLIDAYVLRVPAFKSWTDDERAKLKNLAYKAACPAFLYTCADLLTGEQKLTENNILAEKADKFAQTWEEYEQTNFK
jgi:hypothetical protein